MPEFILAYSLGTVGGVPTSDEARDAFRNALKAAKWKRSHKDPDGILRRLPETTVVGMFTNPGEAKLSIEAAKKAGTDARPGPFRLSCHVLSPFALEALTGPSIRPKPTSSTNGTSTARAPGLQRLKLKRD